MVARRYITAFTLTVAIGLTGCGSSSGNSAAGAKKDFAVVAVVALTGPVAASAKATTEGLQAAVDSINASGGVMGEKASLTVLDDAGDPTKSVTLLQSYLDKHTPQLVIPGNNSNQALAMLPVLTRKKVLSMSQGQSNKLNDPARYPYFFGYNSVPQDTVKIVSLLKARGDRSVALLAANDALGQSTVDIFKATFAKAGIELAVDQYAPTDLDMKPQLQRLQAARPQTLLIQSYGATAGYILKGRTELGWDVPTLGAPTLGNGNNLALVSSPADWKNLTLFVNRVNTPQHLQSPAFDDLLARLKTAGSKLDQPFQIYSTAWDSVHLAKLGAEQAKSTDGPAMAKALENRQETQGGSSLVSFSKEIYSTSNHFFDLSSVPDANAVVAPGPIVGGFIQSVSP